MWLGPRSEWNVFDATWTCLGSFFDGTPVDCVRSNNGSGLGPVRHRLEAQDSDLGNAGATYWYEGYYLVNGDQNLDNNLGSRRTTMSWNGFSWQFSTPGGGNPLVEGPTLLNRWGDKRVKAGLKPHDGNVILSVETTDLGNGQWRYEYALYNWDLDRKIDSFSLPVSGPTFNHYFHDVDFEAATDWKVSTADNTLTWAWDGTMPTTHLEGGALEFGHLYNFGFTSGRPPADRNATLGISEAGLGGDLLAVDTTGPDFFELTASVLSPVEGQNISVDMRGGFDLAVAVVLSVNGTPITPTFLGPAIPFVSGNASIPVTIPSGLSGVCVEVVAADVDAGLNVHQLSNIMELCVQ
jgi:hypothetical protein